MVKIDDVVGKVIDELEEDNLLEDTFEAFSKEYYYERSYYDKECLEDCDQRVKECQNENERRDYYKSRSIE